MGALQEGMSTLISLGLVDVVLPFLLIFGVSYGALQKMRLFGKTGNYRNYNALIAFCLGFFVVYNYNIVSNLPEFAARIGILFIVILVLMIVSGIFGLNKAYNKNIMMLVILTYLAYTVIDVYFPNFKIILSESLIVTIVTVVVFGGLVWFVLRPSKKTSSQSTSSKPSKDLYESKKETSKPSKGAPKQDELVPEPPIQRNRRPPTELYDDLEQHGGQMRKEF